MYSGYIQKYRLEAQPMCCDENGKMEKTNANNPGSIKKT